jgi:hypothetical protein
MLRILPICGAPWRLSCPLGSIDNRPPAPWEARAQSPWESEAAEKLNEEIDLDEWQRWPLEHLSTALTIQNALLQRNVLLQTGINSEHVGILVRFQLYSAKGASLPAVMPAVWATPEFAERVRQRHELLKAPLVGQAAARVDLSG